MPDWISHFRKWLKFLGISWKAWLRGLPVTYTCIYMLVFNPRWDMHSLRAKEIKDSPNSQAVPKILVLLKNGTVWFHIASG